jgi:hypothetical protein
MQRKKKYKRSVAHPVRILLYSGDRCNQLQEKEEYQNEARKEKEEIRC